MPAGALAPCVTMISTAVQYHLYNLNIFTAENLSFLAYVILSFTVLNGVVSQVSVHWVPGTVGWQQEGGMPSNPCLMIHHWRKTTQDYISIEEITSLNMF